MGRRHNKYPEGFTRQGVVNMDKPDWRKVRQGLAPSPKPVNLVWPELDQEGITDVLYTNGHTAEVQGLLLKRFPDAQLEVPWDEIHGYRMSVEMPGTIRRDWYKWLFLEGLTQLSLWFQVDQMKNSKVLLLSVRAWAAEKYAEGGSE